jgi:hypothetical protein
LVAKEASPKVVKLEGRVTLVKRLLAKAQLPIVVTVLGIFILVN